MCLPLRSNKNIPVYVHVLRLRESCDLYFESGIYIFKSAFLNAMVFLEEGLNCTLAPNVDQFSNDWMMLLMGSA